MLAIVGWRDARGPVAGRYSVLFDLCAIAFLVETAPLLTEAHPPWIIPVQILSMATPAVFQLWAAATFDDLFVPGWWRWLPFGGMIALATGAIATNWPPAWRFAQIAALLLVLIGIWQTLAGREADLVEGRRRFRLVLALGAGLCIAGLTLLAVTTSRDIRAFGRAIGAAGVLVLALIAALLRLHAKPHAAQAQQPATTAAEGRDPAPAPAIAIDGEESALLDRLRFLMENDRVYREEGVSIARLAVRMPIPEYRLRRLIHRRLGHRNFTSFINSYRLAETMAALADPGQMRVPVLTIALDAGFQSIGPFNRAFKTHTGLTPTEFRRGRLEQAQVPIE